MNQDEAFILQIQQEPDNPEHRMVYSDYLEDQDDPRAEFLRMELKWQQQPNDESLQQKLESLRRSIDPAWLAAIDRAPVENCQAEEQVKFEFQCPKQWEKLTLTDDPNVRHCEACEKQVHHCGSIEEANSHARNGHCIAVDSRLTQRPMDETGTKPQLPPRGYQVLLGRVATPTPDVNFLPKDKVRITTGMHKDSVATVKIISTYDNVVGVEIVSFGRTISLEIPLTSLERIN